MTISFNQIPANILTPGIYNEFDASEATTNSPAKPHTVLIHGLRSASGTVAELVAKQVFKASDAEGWFGQGSQISEMIRVFRAVNPSTKVIAIAQNENGAGVAATGTFVFAGTATAAGTVAIYIGDTRVVAGVASGATATAVATAVAAAINASLRLPVTAASSTGTVTVTARHKGTPGNSIYLAKNLRNDDADVAGITNTVTAMASGATNPSASAVIAVLGAVQYDSIATGINDSANLTLWETEMTNRWGPMTGDNDGVVISALRGSVSTLTTAVAAPARNSAFTVIMGSLSPTVPWVVAANLAALESAKTSIDATGITTGQQLVYVAPPAAVDTFDRTSRDVLLDSGVSTFILDGGGVPTVERVVTTYQKNTFNIDDYAYQDLYRVRGLSYLRYDLKKKFVPYIGFKLGDDGNAFDPGVKVMTPKRIKGITIAWYQDKIRQGHVENLEAFKASLLVERNSGDKNRVDMQQHPDIINQFYALAVQTLFQI